MPPPDGELSEALISLVKAKLPPQPWPTGIHKEIAQEIGTNQTCVARAIQELIRRRIFSPQIDGVLYAPVSQGQPCVPVADAEPKRGGTGSS